MANIAWCLLSCILIHCCLRYFPFAFSHSLHHTVPLNHFHSILPLITWYSHWHKFCFLYSTDVQEFLTLAALCGYIHLKFRTVYGFPYRLINNKRVKIYISQFPWIHTTHWLCVLGQKINAYYLVASKDSPFSSSHRSKKKHAVFTISHIWKLEIDEWDITFVSGCAILFSQGNNTQKSLVHCYSEHGISGYP